MFSIVICFSVDVPAVATRVLPFMSASVLMFDDFLLSSRLPITNMVGANATCCWRSRLLVVEPHSRSMVPFAISGMRLAEVTGFIATFSLGSPSSVRSAPTTFMHRSTE